VTPHGTLVLRGGKIASVGTGAPPAGVKRIDMNGKYVLPGLIDCHTHLSTLAAARAALESGVTTVRTAGVSNYADVGLRELVRQGAVAGPDVVAAGYQVRPRLAEEVFLSDPSLANLMGGVEGPDAIRRVVRMNLSHGVDCIKVLATERAGTPGDRSPQADLHQRGAAGGRGGGGGQGRARLRSCPRRRGCAGGGEGGRAQYRARHVPFR
jgi:imidazolonepropionase-like amidohydrolase